VPKYEKPVVICSPIGFEYIRAHQTIRRLAENLSAAGFTVLRFDYHGCGDSIGSDRDDDRVAKWLESIATVVQFARELSGNHEVNLIGLRMGATLAYKSTENLPIANLILWNPCPEGRTFVRDMQIVEQAGIGSSMEQRPPDIAVDAAGFILTDETVSSLSQLQMSKVRPVESPAVLLIERDDLPALSRVLGWLTDQDLAVDVFRASGHKEMMLPPQRSQVPATAIESMTSWLQGRSETTDFPSSGNGDGADIVQSGDLTPGNGINVRESAVWFGESQRLFGIVSQPNQDEATDMPAIILLCGGAVHRVSANRMYVPLARRLASIGFKVLRMDISGVGDSRCASGARGNRPYARSLRGDVDAAMQMLSKRFDARRFVLAGICSGAYAAMQIAKSSDKVAGLVLINQLVYFLSGEGPNQIESEGNEVVGAEDFPRANTVFDRVARKVLRRTCTSIGWPSRLLVRRSLGGDLSAALLDIVEREIPIDFIFSADDPAKDALMLYAGKTVNKLIAKQAVTLTSIAGADHTFNSVQSQDEVLKCIVENLTARWCR